MTDDRKDELYGVGIFLGFWIVVGALAGMLTILFEAL
jgi:hypothetical protein